MYKMFILGFMAILVFGCNLSQNDKKNTSPKVEKSTKTPAKAKANSKNQTYWVKLKKTLKLKDGQITKLKKARIAYNKAMKESPNKKEKHNKEKQRKERKILGSKRAYDAYTEFTKNWNKTNGK